MKSPLAVAVKIPLPCNFIQANAGGAAHVQRACRAINGDAQQKVAGFLPGFAHAEGFVAHNQHCGAGEVCLVEGSGALGAGANDLRGMGQAAQEGDGLLAGAEAAEGHMEQGADAGPDALGIVEISCVAGGQNGAGAEGVRGADDGAQIAGGVGAITQDDQRVGCGLDGLAHTRLQITTLVNQAHQLAGVLTVAKLCHHVAGHGVEDLRVCLDDHILGPAGEPFIGIVAHGVEGFAGGNGLLHGVYALQEIHFGVGALLPVAAQGFKPLENVAAGAQGADLRHGGVSFRAQAAIPSCPVHRRSR